MKREFTEKEVDLFNKIISYMTENQMTLEQFDKISEEIKKIYHKNAIIKG